MPGQKPQIDVRKIVYLTVFLTLVLHGGLLPFTVGQTYDAYIHMFFGDHYHRSWFDPWEPRWYTGFTVTSYPPGSHQLIGLLLYLVPHKAAFILVQTASVAILAIGVYRFSRLWVSDLAAALAALLFVASTAIAETLHIFGQLPTTLSIALFLNATPHIYAWIYDGRRRDIPLALIFTAGATAAHHVTPIFATLLFVAPLGIHAWVNALPKTFRLSKRPSRAQLGQLIAAPLRGLGLGLAMLLIITLVVYPYWYWSITDPITQVSIPHGSRESFLERPDLGLMFFVIPWGLLIFTVPYVIWSVFRSRLWPLALSVLLCLFLGTGGTTPFPKLLLGPAFDILTLDRFTFWATILILPFAGTLATSLLEGRTRAYLDAAFGKALTRLGLAIMAAIYGLAGISVAILPLLRPTQPAYIDPGPLVQFMAEDNHNDWRYLTLGFGDQFAYHSALIDGLSVDGNYHSARRLSHLTSYSVERLENSKYLGVLGLGSLQQFVTNADDYSLKYIFSNDEFYDPLLYYGGWTRLLRLRNGVVVWEKPGVKPVERPLPRRSISKHQALMWGTVPPASLLLVFACLAAMTARGKLVMTGDKHAMVKATSLPDPGHVFKIRIAAAAISILMIGIAAIVLISPKSQPDPEAVVTQHYMNLDMRDFKSAHALLQEASRPDYELYLKSLRSRGGLIGSYSKLLGIETQLIEATAQIRRIATTRTYLTAVGMRTLSSEETVVMEGGEWRLSTPPANKQLTNSLKLESVALSSHDAALTRSPQRGTGTSNLDRPRLEAPEPVLINVGDRVRVIGQVTNTSSHSACVRGAATARFEGDDSATEYMGVLGAHRLHPGETRHYSLEYEGVLTLSDARLGQGFDPEFFRLPEFEANPEKVDVAFTSQFCDYKSVEGLVISNIKVAEGPAPQTLALTLSNLGTKTASVIKLSIVYLDAKGAAVLVEPHYLETNLIPGEIKSETIALNNGDTLTKVKRLSAPKINGRSVSPQRFRNTSTIKLPHGGIFSAVRLEIDAMPFEPTF
ncbi:MAG: membrane protein [Henriciella sp.]